MTTVKESIINALTLFWDKISTVLVRKSNIVDNCASTATTFPLSANQGTKLQNQIDELNSNIISRTRAYSNITLGSNESMYRFIDDIAIEGYTPVFAKGISGTEGRYNWLSVYIMGQGAILLKNQFTSSITTDISVCIWYIKL